MIERAKGVEIGGFGYYNTFKHLWFKHVFGPKLLNYKDVFLTKVIHSYVIKNTNA
jgi:hypothetical protein